MTQDITAIILAGGKSSRIGFDKGLAEIHSVKMIERVLSVAKKTTNNIIIISNNSSYNFLGLPVYEDIIKDCGPIGGIYTGLNYSKTDYNIVIACDMPFIEEGIINRLLDNCDDYDVVVPLIENNFEPLCACYNKSITPFLKTLIENKEYSVYKAIKQLRYKPILLNIDEISVTNINTPNDLEKYNK